MTIKELPDKNFGIGGKTIDIVKSEYMKAYKQNSERCLSYLNVASAEKRKLFPLFRENEYFVELDDYNTYFEKLIIKLPQADYDSILKNFAKPNNMENWQYQLIAEENLLSNCASKYIAISPDRTYCYLIGGKRPSDTIGSIKVE